MSNYRTLLVTIPLFCLPFLMADLAEGNVHEVKRFHSAEEIATFEMMVFDTMLPEVYNDLFAGSGVCIKCHGYDTLGIASVDAFGNDVNVIDDWRATMMANSAKDPFWRAKVSHEVLLYPQHQADIEDKCTSCHAPLGHFDAKHTGQSHYMMSDLVDDVLGQDGVSCLACHQQSEEEIGFTHSGLVNFDTFNVAYGPYMNPLVSPMLTETGYKPEFSDHISDAGLCAGCHTLLTETIDYEGNLTGNTFVEQATYHEWLNSSFEDSVSCQGCHMPDLDKYPVFLVTGAQTEPRNPYFLHEFVGGNVTMLKLLRDNIDELNLKANEAQFNEVIAKTEAMLQDRSIGLDLDLLSRTPDTAFFALKVTNKAGHKFPSGYPSRRAYIEFLVQNEAGDTLFISGKTDGEFEVYGQNPTYEPHYKVISAEEQVQIYELVLGDVNGAVTTVLLRADHPIKDNRLPPAGFTTSHPAYDTTRIAGAALEDEDFNFENGVEGTGSDVVYYHIPMNGNVEHLQITAKVYYQPTPPKWMKEMFDESTPEIESFRSMFEAADRTPVLMQGVAIDAAAISAAGDLPPDMGFVRLYPVPTTGGMLSVEAAKDHVLQIFDVTGRVLQEVRQQRGTYQIRLPVKGILLLQFTGKNGEVQMERVVN